MADPVVLGITDQFFTNLLASAYSLQQRQDQIKSRVTPSKFRDLVSAVLDVQGLVLHHTVHPDTAMHLIASRTQNLCGSAGTAIALVDGEDLDYKVAIGIAVGLLGAKILADTSSSFEQLRSQQVVESDSWRDHALHTRVMAKSILSVPIHRNGTLAGCFQLFSRLGHFGEDSIYACELMSGVLTQVIEEIDALCSRDEQVGAVLNTHTGREARKQATERVDKNGSAPKSKVQLQPRQTNPIAAAPIKVEAPDRSQSLPLKQKLLWPVERETPAGTRKDRSDLGVEKTVLGLPGGDFGNPSENAHTQVGLNQRNDLSTNSGQANGCVDRHSSDGRNSSEQDHGFQNASRRPRIWTRGRTMIYLVFVILFVGFANIPGWSRGRPLELATIIMVALTTAELVRLWLKHQ